jgi:hypothetical protein
MPACCGADAYRQLFDERNARRDAERYLKKGLDFYDRDGMVVSSPEAIA